MLTLSWRPGHSVTVYSGAYAPISASQTAYSSTVDLTATPDVRVVAFPGWVAVVLAVLLVVLVGATPERRTPLAVLSAAATAATLASAPALQMPLGSALLRLAVVLLPALTALLMLRILTGAQQQPAPPEDDAGGMPPSTTS